jgi:hypothetical protein
MGKKRFSRTDNTDASYQKWQEHGAGALDKMATSEPAKFCQMIAGLLPKEMHIKESEPDIFKPAPDQRAQDPPNRRKRLPAPNALSEEQ